ncbi:Ras association domain-containing protein 8 [Frankliniella fusca]|uniref:Ras association domain-containing protein 8 n=1 Tax=Frankliniella fusca TaxID=407009 RepID=A0AAE1I187_9NEOP|nr:Ras association domain-containing protein 8 [Frankliniella fusca]
MELKVWVEGIQRIVCGVTETTTCQDVVYALAHATGKTGRFTLIERWRNNERLLAPHEHPLKILMKWGEYSNDVQLILQRSGGVQQTLTGPSQQTQAADPLHGFSPSPSESPDSRHSGFGMAPERNKDIRKSLTFSGGHHPQTIAERRSTVVTQDASASKSNVDSSSPNQSRTSVNNCPSHHTHQSSQQHTITNPSPHGTKREREAPPYRAPPPGPAATAAAVAAAAAAAAASTMISSTTTNTTAITSSTNSTCSSSSTSIATSPSVQLSRINTAPLPLPPYRDPPPPTQSPVRPAQPSLATHQVSASKPRRNILKDFPSIQSSAESEPNQETVLYNAQYRELIRLVNYQREKLSSQQVELTKFDAEIVFWEGKSQEQKRQMELIAQETSRMEAQSRQSEEQIRALSQVEEESELVRQQEKTLKSEITLLRSKLANCETELLQCKNKIRLLAEETQMEQRALLTEKENRQQLERSLLSEVERLQRQVDLAKQSSEQTAQCGEDLHREVAALESAISDKKQQVEQLVAEMKEANLQSLAIAPAEELKHLLEGPHKPGSTRKMIGSPRQLENAVPTSKNPHGVWV